MPVRKRRMIEIQHGLPLHADTLHQALRSKIGIRRPREDVCQPDPLKPVGQYARRRFAHVPVPPCGTRLPPCDLHARRQRMTAALLVMQAAEADQHAIRLALDCPQAKTVHVEMRIEPIDIGARVGHRHGAARKPRRHLGIGMHRRERLGITRPPPAQRQAFRRNLQ